MARSCRSARRRQKRAGAAIAARTSCPRAVERGSGAGDTPRGRSRLSRSLAAAPSRADLERVKRDQQEMRARLADVQVSLDAINRRLDTVRTDARPTRAAAAIPPRCASCRSASPISKRTPRRSAPPPAEGSPRPPTRRGAATPNIPRTEAANIALRARRSSAARPRPTRHIAAPCRAIASGQSDQAIQQFREYLRNNPKSDLADNAQYWIGEAYYSKGDYNRSIIELNEVLLKYPQGDQVPGALLALATAFQNSGDQDRRQAHPAEADQRSSEERGGERRPAAAADVGRLARRADGLRRRTRFSSPGAWRRCARTGAERSAPCLLDACDPASSPRRAPQRVRASSAAGGSTAYTAAINACSREWSSVRALSMASRSRSSLATTVTCCGSAICASSSSGCVVPASTASCSRRASELELAAQRLGARGSRRRARVRRQRARRRDARHGTARCDPRRAAIVRRSDPRRAGAR